MGSPKKALGQHWLQDEEILQAIIEAGDVSAKDYVLEIGPGEGTLTRQLAACGADVVALEFDQDLVPKLTKAFTAESNVEIREGDIRQFDFTSLPHDYKVVANIPYYLTSHLVRQLTETLNKPLSTVLLVQKEVAERIAARPGQMSVLSCVAQYWYDCSLDVEVPAEYFTPPPKVDSQVVVMKRRSKPVVSVPFDDFTLVISAGFSQKRKKLANSLQAGLRLTKQQAAEVFATGGIDGNKRAQHLSLSDWGQLTIAYQTLK